MKGILKWTAAVTVVLLVLIVAVLLIVPHFIDVKHYRPLIEKQVSKATGRSFTIGEDLRFSLFPWAGLSFSDLRLGNPPGFAESDFVTVGSFDARVKLLPLLFREIEVQRFILKKPRIVLVRNREGHGNWEFPREKTGEPAKGAPPEEAGEIGLPIKSLEVGAFDIENGTVLLADHTSGLEKEVTDIGLVLENLSLDKAIGVSLSARVDGKPVSVKGTVGPVGPGMGTGTIPLNIVLALLDEIDVAVKGEIESPAADPRFRLALNGDRFSPRRVFEALGKPFPVNTADPGVLSGISFAATVQGSPDAVDVSGGTIVLDDTTVNFSLKAREFSRPDIAFDLHADKIDLDRYLPPRPEAGSDKAEESKKPVSAGEPEIDYGPLRRLVLDGQLKVDAYRVAGARMEDLLVRIRGKNGVFKADPLQVRLYGGNVSGEKTFDVQGKVPKAAARLSVKGLQAGPLLEDVLKKDFLEGMATADLKMSLTGVTAGQIRKSLNGEGMMQFNDGAVKGIDLAAMARNVKTAFGAEAPGGPRPRTDFAEVTVPFTVTDGLVNVSGAAMKAPFIRLEAAGKANLVDETLDFRVVPKAVATIKGQGDDVARSGLLVPILVSGTFEKPVFMPDLKSLLQREIDKGLLEKEPVKKLLEKEEIKQIEEPVKTLLKDLMKKQ
ncbi:MAG TPA: AsmA family protein [Syntrophales bacterium]|nr:AsmA family protein [Syntrophales bacterium]